MALTDHQAMPSTAMIAACHGPPASLMPVTLPSVLFGRWLLAVDKPGGRAQAEAERQHSSRVPGVDPTLRTFMDESCGSLRVSHLSHPPALSRLDFSWTASKHPQPSSRSFSSGPGRRCYGVRCFGILYPSMLRKGQAYRAEPQSHNRNGNPRS